MSPAIRGTSNEYVLEGFAIPLIASLYSWISTFYMHAYVPGTWADCESPIENEGGKGSGAELLF